nr:uncharacterized mitochondrial protein AtMg00810-like [Tanacetum cinerariifolium]
KGCVEKVFSATKLPEGGNSHSTYSPYHLEGKVIFKGVRNVTPWAADGGRRKRVKCYVKGSRRQKRKKVIGRDSGRQFVIDGKSASTPIDTEKSLLKDPDGEDVDVHTYISLIGSLIKKIFRYLKGKPHLGLWYPKDLPFDLVAYSDSDYAGASLDKKSTIRGCQFLGCRLISWQYKKQTVVATSSTEDEYVATARVTTHRCDEDRLELIKLMVFLLPKVEKVRIGVSAVEQQVSAVRLMLLLLVQKFLLFEQTDGEAMLNSIKNGDQPLPRVTQVSIAGTTSTEQPPLKDKSTWSDQEKRVQKIDRLARSLLIQGLSNDIYSLIASNKTAKDLWD